MQWVTQQWKEWATINRISTKKNIKIKYELEKTKNKPNRKLRGELSSKLQASEIVKSSECAE
jgi:hypothetical protein